MTQQTCIKTENIEIKAP